MTKGGSRPVGTAIFFLSAGLLLWQSFLYPLTLLAVGALWGKRQRSRLGYTPALTVIIPTYNEAATIRRRLANLRDCQYPGEALQVIVVDSGSTDGTGEVVEGAWVDRPLLVESYRKLMTGQRWRCKTTRGYGGSEEEASVDSFAAFRVRRGSSEKESCE